MSRRVAELAEGDGMVEAIARIAEDVEGVF
jgi:hypothetical protein